MNENTAPDDVSKLVDPARMLISPPPEEELQRAHLFPRTNTAPPKRKRPGVASTPSKPAPEPAPEPVEATPNPKPRKTHRRPNTSTDSASASPTRAAFARRSPHPRNPDADWLPLPKPRDATPSRRRSPTPVPYEPPSDVFVPPREIVLATPQQPPRNRKAPARRPSAQPSPVRIRAPSATPLRVVIHSVKKEPPALDLARPMTPPSPTDDPLLLVASSSPAKHVRSSDADYPAFDWTQGRTEQEQDGTSDSMDLDPPESFDGPLPGADFTNVGGWDSDSDDDGDLPAVSATTVPIATTLPSRTHTLPSPSPTSQPPFTIATTTQAPATTAAPSPSLATQLPSTTTTAPTTTQPTTATATGPYTTLLLRTKPDPPTPRTHARAAAWGVWGSPYPGCGEGSFRMDGRRANASVLFPAATSSGLAGASASAGVEEQRGEDEMQMQREEEEEEEEEESDEEMDDGVSFLRALREEDAVRRAARARGAYAERGGRGEEQEQEQEYQDGEELQDERLDEEQEREREQKREREREQEQQLQQHQNQPEDEEEEEEEEEAEVRRMSLEPETPARSWAPSYTQQTPARIAPQTQSYAPTPPTRRAPVVPPRAEWGGAGAVGVGVGVDEDVEMRGGGGGAAVLQGTGERVPLRNVSFGGAPAATGTGTAARTARPAGVQVAAADDDDDEDDSDSDDPELAGMVQITSADPRAAARAAAILKQHDYDCFTRLNKRRRHSYHGGVRKAASPAASGTSKSAAAGNKSLGAIGGSRVQDIAVLAAKSKALRVRQSESVTTQKEMEEMKEMEEREGKEGKARVVGERVYFPGSPGPVSTAQLLREAEREVESASPVRGAGKGAAAGRRKSMPAALALHPRAGEDGEDGEGEGEGEGEAGAEAAWGKAQWKALDACFTDERIAVAQRAGVVHRPTGAFSTPVRGAVGEKVMMAPAEGVDVGAVVARFARTYEGGAWGLEEMMQRARAIQAKQQRGHVAPPTPSASASASASGRVHAFNKPYASSSLSAFNNNSVSSPSPSPTPLFAGHNRRPSMEVAPLGRRALPPRASLGTRAAERVPFPAPPIENSARKSFPAPAPVVPSFRAPAPVGTRARLPPPMGSGAPFSALPPTPEGARARGRRVPGSLLAPRYSHLLEEAVAVSGAGGGGVGRAEEKGEDEEGGEDGGEQQEEAQEQQEEEGDASFDSSVDGDADADMAPATPLREREAPMTKPKPAPAPKPATIGKRVSGFLFSYLPTLAKSAPRRPPGATRPRLPLPPPDVLAKPRGPVKTPVRAPLPRAPAPKELVTLQPAPAPAPKTLIPRRAAPRRLVELHHVSPPPVPTVTERGVRPRTSSGGSVKDLVKNFEALDGARKGAGAGAGEVKRVRSVGDFGKAGAGRPAWR
ncbi:hypothetical protein B0H15DRAFT_981464 [Mycena belliarum]|uniref:Uncharacterized protein n=1 Tax=Mycena belliarum TaxID=1033014 RepID=A0AAD6U6A9_9AGAR|nr:hypothetical protein B0H15DRAFT_981464 [Mycena belliae]